MGGLKSALLPNQHRTDARLIFLSILYAGPEYTAAVKLQIRDVPTKMMIEPQTNIMTNLGYYIRVHELNAFQEIIDSID